ncbi:MAG: hypothetical protein R3C14_15195 [Caldilineaceae bacterium]
MKRPYSQIYFPAAPLLQVRFGNPENMQYTKVADGFIDTSADSTIVPISFMREIGAAIGGLQSLRSQWGEARTVKTYIVDVEVEGINFPGIWVVGDEIGDEIVLGRNLLNRMRILLDGLAETIEIMND